MPPTFKRDVRSYKKVPAGELSLHLALPKNNQSMRPAMVLFHGGGWRNGQPKKMFRLMEALAEQGMVACSVEYRLAEDPGLQQLPTEPIEDARSALRWVRAHARDIGVDPQRIGAGGISAGGHLALMAAMDVAINAADDDLSVSPRPDALLLISTPFDLTAFPSPIPEAQRRRVSPLHLLDAKLPPTLILHGSDDPKIPVSQAEAFVARARELGVSHLDFVRQEGRKHALKALKGDGEDGGLDDLLNDLGRLLTHLGWR